MARCGCSSQCSCSVIAGTGVTVTGTGSAADPYVVNAGGASLQVADTTTVDHTLAGSGTAADPYILSSTVKVSAAVPDNLITVQADGLAVQCEAVQDCVGSAIANGLIYDDGANQIRVRPSTDPGNNLTFGGDGGVFVPTGAATISVADTSCINLSGNGAGLTPVTADPIIDPAAGNLLTCEAGGLRADLVLGCGLQGNGNQTPLAANVQAWPYPCAPETFGGGIYCDANGELRGEPVPMVAFQGANANTAYADLAVPAGTDVPIESRTLNVVNPSTCKPAFVIFAYELDVDFNLPASGGAGEYGIDSDALAYMRNSGSSAITDWHVQVTKVFDSLIIPPGGASLASLNVTMGRGAGGATYNRIQTLIRAFVFVL